jgi:hypothetical protein
MTEQPTEPTPVDTKEPVQDPEAEGPPPEPDESQDDGETPIPDLDDDPER